MKLILTRLNLRQSAKIGLLLLVANTMPALSYSPSVFAVEMAVSAPTNLSVATGGDSTVVMWSQTNKSTIARYDIYRNSVKVGSSAPNTSAPIEMNKDGTRFVDRNVNRSTTYGYSVVAVAKTGEQSQRSSTVSVTLPANTTPSPTINTNSSVDPSMATWLNSVVKPEAQLWYQKISDKIAYPTYTPPTSLTIKIEDLPYPAHASGNVVSLSKTYFKAHPDEMGVVIHELTHVVSVGGTYSVWEHESIADWVRLRTYRDTGLTVPALTLQHFYDQGYTVGAQMLAYIQQSKPNIVKDLNVAIHNGNYYPTFFANRTGKSADAWWTQMTGFAVKSGELSLSANRALCADVPGSSRTAGTVLQLWGCNNTDAQRFAIVTNSSGASTVHVMGKCMDVRSSGTTEGTPVQIWDCNATNAQRWKHQPSGSLLNMNSGKCLTPQSVGSSADLMISNCTGASQQLWIMASQSARDIL